MNSKTFQLAIKNGTLDIPQEVTEYLHQCQGKIDVSLTIQASPSSSSNNGERELQLLWKRWFDEVETLESSRESTDTHVN